VAGSRLVVQNDGNVVIYTAGGAPVWQSATCCARAPDLMRPGDSIYPTGSRTSSDGNFKLTYQTDGNLVVYHLIDPSHPELSSSWQYTWNTGTWNHPAGHLQMQVDGNLVIYDAFGTAVWATTAFTFGHYGAYLKMQTDGNLVVYDLSGAALWWPGR
jgi:hypothetical protein